MWTLLVIIALVAPLGALAPQDGETPTCNEWRECQQLALLAAERSDYETFHSLAWRTYQTGAKNDPALMYLVARAQSLSGRPGDALVMLRRLAAAGVNAVDAETNADFARARALPQWPDVLAILHEAALKAPSSVPVATSPAASTRPGTEAASAPASEPAPERAAAPVPVPAPPVVSPSVSSEPPAASSSPAPAVTEAVEGHRLPASMPTPIAMAYDAVSRRFVLADEGSNTLKIIDDLAGHVVDLISRQWAGPYLTSALAIDSRRGDLWVVGTHEGNADGESRSAIHKLQLVSGRLLHSIAVADEAGATRFVAIALTGRGAAYALDAEGGRIFRLDPGSQSLVVQMTIDTIEPSGLAAAGDAVLYVAHRAGIDRLNLTTGTSAPLQAARGVDLRNLQWIGAHTRSLIGMQEMPDGNHAVVRIRLDARGRTATRLEVLDVAVSRAASIEGGMLYYLAKTFDGDGVILRRLPL